MTFLVELIAYRIGTAKAESLAYDPHHQTDNHQHVAETHMEVHAHGPEAHAGISKDVDSLTPSDIEKADEKLPISAQASEILGVMVSVGGR